MLRVCSILCAERRYIFRTFKIIFIEESVQDEWIALSDIILHLFFFSISLRETHNNNNNDKKKIAVAENIEKWGRMKRNREALHPKSNDKEALFTLYAICGGYFSLLILVGFYIRIATPQTLLMDQNVALRIFLIGSLNGEQQQEQREKNVVSFFTMIHRWNKTKYSCVRANSFLYDHYSCRQTDF